MTEHEYPRWYKSSDEHRRWFVANRMPVPWLYRFDSDTVGYAFIDGAWKLGTFSPGGVPKMISDGLRLREFVAITRAEADAMTGGRA